MGVEFSRPTVIPLITLLLLFVVWIRFSGDYASRPSRERRRPRRCSEERPAHWRHAAPAYSPGASASCAWPIARRRRRSSLPQSKTTFWACTALTASRGTRNSPAFSTYTTRPSGDTSRTAPNSSSASETNVWYPTSIVSRMIHSPDFTANSRSMGAPGSLQVSSALVSRTGTLEQPCLQVDLRSGQRLRHGTVLLGVQRIPLKRRLVDARNVGL